MEFTTFDLEEIGISNKWSVTPTLPEIDDRSNSVHGDGDDFEADEDRNVILLSDEDLTAEDPQAVIPPVRLVLVGDADGALKSPMSLEGFLPREREESNKEEARAPQRKKKKYEQDPKTDPTGRIKNAINAKLNRTKKKQEVELLKKEIKAQTLRAEEAVGRCAEFQDQIEVLQQDKNLLILRLQQVEAQLAGNNHSLDDLYSEICSHVPEYGEEIERQVQQLFAEQQQ